MCVKTDKIIIDGVEYKLIKEGSHKKFEVTCHINGVQRCSKVFNNVEDFNKWKKQKHSIIFDERIDTFEMKIRWLDENET